MAKKRKPVKSSKPLSRRKSVQESNKKMVDFFAGQLNSLRSDVGQFEQAVRKSNQELFENQQRQADGLKGAEEHVVLIRRVLNDALGGVTRVRTIERRAEGTDEMEEAQVIDWGWYGEQAHYSENREAFMNGVVLTDDEIKERVEKEKIETRHKVVFYLAGQSASKDEDRLRKAREDGDLNELLKSFLPPQGIQWEDEMSAIAPDIVDKVLEQRDKTKQQKEKMDAFKEKALLKTIVQRMIASGDGDKLDSANLEELVAGLLPGVVQWTDSMSKLLPEVIEEIRKEAVEEEENDPEDVEREKQKLLDETKEFGEKAAHAIDMIKEGKEEEAEEAMAELEQKVKDKELEAARNAPEYPDGAEIFGGS